MTMTGSAHKITIGPTPGRIRVTFNGTVVADTTRALTLREGSLPPVQYLPREDAVMTAFAPTDRRTHCPFKGDASYFSLSAGGKTVENAVWTYEAPFDAVASIAGHLAFYPDKVKIEQI